MKRGWVVLLGLLPAVVAQAQESQPVASRIQKVTVYSDRAQVTRGAAVEVDASASVWAFPNLPGWVDEGSVRVTLQPADVGQIADVRVQREYLARSNDAELRKAEAAAQEIANQIAVLDDEVRILAAQEKQVETIRAFSLEKIGKDSVMGTVQVATYGEVVKFLGDALRDLATRRRAVQQAKAALEPERLARARRVEDLRGLGQLEETTVFVSIDGRRKAQARVELTYMLPGATWEPAHELRVAGTKPGAATLASYAVVSQATGEDWENAEIAFSTQSATESIRIPELESLTLGDTKPTSRFMASRTTSFSRAQKAYEGQNRMWNQRRSTKVQVQSEEVYEESYHDLQTVQSKTVEVFRTLQVRGTTTHFRGEGRATVRGDGRPARLRIGQCTLTPSQRVVAAPEQSLNAARILEMTNGGGQPLLPGKVALFQEGAFLGMTDLGFVAEQEKFSLFLAVADEVKLSRVLDKTRSSLVRKARTRMVVSFEVGAENLSDHDVTVTLADRIPVSEDKEIRIDQVSVEPAGAPDDKGLITWTLQLKPREKRVFRISYRVEYPPALVLEMKRAGRPSRAASPAPAADAPIGEQLMDLESNF
jgi:uncharacterized protein (TIGR02231 family)